MTYTVTQGDETFEVEPLSYRDWTVEEFYSYDSPDGASANTPTDLEESGVSQLFLYEGPDGISLVVIHDEPNDGSGGDVTFGFDTLPAGGSWVVPDDPGESFSATRADWRWVACCTDGGAYRGGLDDEFSVTITPTFRSGIHTWQVLSGDADAPERTELDRGRPVTIASGPREVSASAAALTYIPGFNENSSEDGDELNSAIPDSLAILDNAFHGDDRLALEADLADATAVDKELEEYSRPFPHYRVANRIDVSFPTSDGTDIDGDVTVESEDRSELSPITLEGDESDPPNPFRSVLDLVHGGEETKDPVEREHFVSEIEITIRGVEGVRASAIFGGADQYIKEWADQLRVLGFVAWISTIGLSPSPLAMDYLLTLPTFYTFLEVTLMADGTRVARVWDAGRYPKHALYLDGEKDAETDFDLGEEWERNEPLNPRFREWVREAKTLRHPYQGPRLAYKVFYESGGGPHPVLVGSREGDELDVADVIENTRTPHFPF